MPNAAPKPCCQCGTLVLDGTTRCHAHKRKAWAKPAEREGERITGRRLQRMRHELFAREPLCRVCKHEGRVTLASIRDHIQPLAEGGADVDENVQPLCQACSDAKTAAEAARGVARGRGGRAPTPGGGQMSGGPQAETDLQVKFSRAEVSGEGVPVAEQWGAL